MTSLHSLEVLDALTAADVDDRIRQAAQTIYQALIEAELTSMIGAARTSEHLTGWPSATATEPGCLPPRLGLGVAHPLLRAGSFFSSGGRLRQGGRL